MRRRLLTNLAPYIISGLILFVLPLVLPSYVQSMFAKFLIFGIFAMSLGLLYGFVGLYSLGHAAFFGAGGYTTGILACHYGIENLWVATPIVVLVTLLISAIFGFIALRASGVYFLLLTLALGQLIFTVAWKWVTMTGGDNGLSGIPRPELGFPWPAWDPAYYYYFVLVFFLACFFLLRQIVNSSFGYTLRGIRLNENRMRHLGYPVWGYKYIAFIIAGLFAGISGMLFAYFNGIVVPSHAGITTSVLVFLMVVIGGPGTLFGPVIGAGVIVFLQFFISLYTPEHWPLVLGCVFVAAVMYARGGLSTWLLELQKRMKRRYGNIES